ncbi:hypothetical protein F9C07_9075 [Aspergillus flavus]|uniref:Uncharacterized protein n=1 Tax=Aspergillus flavus (strain ATCC 200026 / FGSC A1120 / IAM 13836 / NRRL 3357 / JCM 12722 / SRRC 167) TaxID=332952 RepID=A0A7U2QTY6_ASPFN|nr:hypothetical protein F9C07_9075 [Aspergillus flavus]
MGLIFSWKYGYIRFFFFLPLKAQKHSGHWLVELIIYYSVDKPGWEIQNQNQENGKG